MTRPNVKERIVMRLPHSIVQLVIGERRPARRKALGLAYSHATGLQRTRDGQMGRVAASASSEENMLDYCGNQKRKAIDCGYFNAIYCLRSHFSGTVSCYLKTGVIKERQ